MTTKHTNAIDRDGSELEGLTISKSANVSLNNGLRCSRVDTIDTVLWAIRDNNMPYNWWVTSSVGGSTPNTSNSNSSPPLLDGTGSVGVMSSDRDPGVLSFKVIEA